MASLKTIRDNGGDQITYDEIRFVMSEIQASQV